MQRCRLGHLGPAVFGLTPSVRASHQIGYDNRTYLLLLLGVETPRQVVVWW